MYFINFQIILKSLNFLTRHDFHGQIAKLLLEHGGSTSNFELSVEDLRGKYLRKFTDYPFVTIPDKYENNNLLHIFV